MIKFVIYTSKASIALSNIDLNDLITIARDNNKKNQITGMLLYLDGFFLQYLEGPENNIDILYKKLSQDNRHTSLEVLESGSIPSRRYAEWQMLFKKISSKEVPQFLKNSNIDVQHQGEIKLNLTQVKEILGQLSL